MKETPILFSTPMVQAILEDRKTKTRRTTGLDFQFEFEQCFADNWNFIGVNLTGHFVFENDKVGGHVEVLCPWGQVGDQIWVRETHKLRAIKNYKKGGLTFQAMYKTPGIKNVYYKHLPLTTLNKLKNVDANKWRPSIFLFKEFSRLWLEVTNMRVERLQDISEIDAEAEGIEHYFNQLFQEERYKDYSVKKNDGFGKLFGASYECRNPSSSFKSLWISINGQESWDANPWVWVVEFKKIERP